MVEISLEYSLTSGETFLLRGRVRNVGDGATPTLLCELEGGNAARPCVGRLKLNQLPAAPFPLCIARAIESATKKPEGQPNLRKTLERASINLSVGGRERLDFVCWRMYDEFEDEVGMLPELGREAMTPWRLGRRMLERAATAWPSAALQSMPPAMKAADGAEYCRAGDLPGPLRALFAHQFCLAPQPQIEGAPDAFFATDIARFLSTLRHDNALLPIYPEDSSRPSTGEPEREWPDLTIAMRKLHELALADGDIGYAYWHDVAQLLKSSAVARKRVEELEQQLALLFVANEEPGRKIHARRRS